MIYILEHSLLEHFLTLIKTNHTPSHFRLAVAKVSQIAATLATKELELEEYYDTDGNFVGYKFSSTILFFTVFPTGLPLLQAFSNILPNYLTGFVSYGQDRSQEGGVVEKFCLLPEKKEASKVFVLDFAINSGNTIKNAVSRILLENFTDITVVSIFSTTDGIENIRTEFPNLPIYVCSLENKEDFIRLKSLHEYFRNISI